MNRLRLYWHRLLRRPAITGPYRLYVRRIPTGALLDVEHYLTHVLTTIADDEELLALLLEFADERGVQRGHDGHAPEQLLLEQIADAVGYELPVYGGEVTALADRLRALAPERPAVAPIHGQRREGGAAA
ncbi:hypothetical protein [Streptomyces sp.]|uniref:hypothetical protein n=1 Tax=Streptomyces sp. TaxID=1931 RepID=UPI002D6FA6C3|nr:hypothetical protein [Streptomyces sp.]HZF92022.1 hypothetical protein [Streptomyces sp.]